MPHIILKKTFKVKPSGIQVATEKSFSFHGAITPEMISAINERLALIEPFPGAKNVAFEKDKVKHYSCEMNHTFQKFHEEDAITYHQVQLGRNEGQTLTRGQREVPKEWSELGWKKEVRSMVHSCHFFPSGKH